VAATILVAALATLTALWLVTRSDLTAQQETTADLQQQVADLEGQRTDLRERNADLERQKADYQAQESQRAAAAAEVPNLRQIADKRLAGVLTVYGTADYVDITLTDANAASAMPGLIAMLDDLGFSPAVIDRMAKTRALDGTLRAEGHNCNVTWTYHPDDGLGDGVRGLAHHLKHLRFGIVAGQGTVVVLRKVIP
jgi:hypothetical protein